MTSRTWSGTLTANGREYGGTASGMFTLLAMLDEMYRADKYGVTAE